jgi:clan AA aspartic protease
MGHVRVQVRFSNPDVQNGSVDVEDALVDTGATWTTIPRSIAAQLSLRLVGQIPVKTAAGPQTLDQSYALVELDEKKMVTPLLTSDTLDGVLIGVTMLEALGLAVDPTSGQLKDSEVFLL